MASPAFERLRFSFFDDEDSARNGLDTRALAAFEGEEARSKTERRTCCCIVCPKRAE